MGLFSRRKKKEIKKAAEKASTTSKSVKNDDDDDDMVYYNVQVALNPIEYQIVQSVLEGLLTHNHHTEVLGKDIYVKDYMDHLTHLDRYEFTALYNTIRLYGVMLDNANSNTAKGSNYSAENIHNMKQYIDKIFNKLIVFQITGGIQGALK